MGFAFLSYFSRILYNLIHMYVILILNCIFNCIKYDRVLLSHYHPNRGLTLLFCLCSLLQHVSVSWNVLILLILMLRVLGS